MRLTTHASCLIWVFTTFFCWTYTFTSSLIPSRQSGHGFTYFEPTNQMCLWRSLYGFSQFIKIITAFCWALYHIIPIYFSFLLASDDAILFKEIKLLIICNLNWNWLPWHYLLLYSKQAWYKIPVSPSCSPALSCYSKQKAQKPPRSTGALSAT